MRSCGLVSGGQVCKSLHILTILTARPYDRKTKHNPMRTKVFLFILTLIMVTCTVQAQNKVARLPKVNHDWRAGFINITELTGGLGLNLTSSHTRRAISVSPRQRVPVLAKH